MKFTIDSVTDPKCRSGVYMGGIGAGGFEPRADGRFYRCQIRNDWRSEKQLDMLILHTDAKGNRHVLRFGDLSLGEGTAPGVEKIVYCGDFPFVTYSFPQCGVSVRFSSFFIPGNIKDSSLPAVTVSVKGKGKVFLMLAVSAGSNYSARGNRAIFTDDDGSVGLWSSTGQILRVDAKNVVWFVRNAYKLQRQWSLKNSGKITVDSYAVVSWTDPNNEPAVISWYYPQWKDSVGNLLQNGYKKHFSSCEKLLTYVVGNLKRLTKHTEDFSKSISASKVPLVIKEAYKAQIASFVKQSWLTSDGLFGVWEGSCACCGLQTTDVAYYGSWLYVNLFPKLDRAGLQLCAKFQRKDGWIPHFFPGTFSKIDEYRRKDMNMQFVLMVYRDVVLHKDISFLRVMYPHVKKAINCAFSWDVNNDGIPEVEPRAQTFDAWDFTGTSIYLATLWLAALKMGALLAQKMADHNNAQKWSKAALGVKDEIVRKFWNGEYFILAAQLDNRRDEACLIDALSGDWYCRLLGIGGLFDDSMVRSHLKACLKYNRKKVDHSYMNSYISPGENGYCLINGGYKDERRIGMQQYEPWTGLEYTFAIHCMLVGLRKEALQTVKDVSERLMSSGHFWNHLECGGDYYRPMVIGAMWELMNGKFESIDTNFFNS